MKILMFPSDRGGGFGHISRCLVVAREARSRGHACAIVLSDRKYERLVGDRFPLFFAKGPGSRETKLLGFVKKVLRRNFEPRPLYVGISGLDYQVVRDGLDSHETVKSILSEYERVVIDFKPDMMIGDTNLLVWILSRRTCIPALQIVRYASHPATGNLVWWEEQPSAMKPPDWRQVFNPILDGLGISGIEKVETLLSGDLYIVPSIPEIEPIPQDDVTFHVGQLSVNDQKEQDPVWFRKVDRSQPLVYITIGGGAGPVGNKLFFRTVIEAFGSADIQVIVSTSAKFGKRDFGNLPKNVKVFQWVPGTFMISKSDLVIFHGGYGTMMECLAYGKPSIVVPYQTEQEGNGRRLEKLGCGRVIMLSRENCKIIGAWWKQGAYSFCVQNRYDLNSEELTRSVSEVLQNDKYSENARRLQSRIKEYGGSKKVLEVIEQRWA